MGGFVGKVISFVGRPFGIYTHDETFTDLQISNLLTVGAADKSGRKNAKINAYRGKGDYFTNYRSFQRDYRRKYSSKFLESVGFNPSSTASVKLPNESSILTFLQTNVDSSTTSVENAIDKFLTLEEREDYYLDKKVGYNRSTHILTSSGKTYTFIAATEGANDTILNVKWRRQAEETIIQNLTDNYSYDSSANTIVSNGITYNVPSPLDFTIYGTEPNDVYRTVCTPTVITDPITPDLTIETSVEYLTDVYTNPLFGIEVLYVTYRTSLDTYDHYYIEDALIHPTLYQSSTIGITAILPLKENNTIIDFGNNNVERLLRKLNLSGDQLKNSLENPDMDGAYLMTGIDPQNVSAPNTKVMFEMFDLITPGNGNITIGISQLSMRYSFSISKSEIAGSIGSVGTYSRINVSDTAITLRFQGTSSHYKELIITDFKQTYTISGHSFEANFGSTGGYCRLVIPLDIYNSLKYKEFVDVYERGLCILAFAVQTVRVQWYETGAFGTILKIVGYVLAIWTAGASLILAAITLVVAYGIGQLLAYIAREIGGTLGVIIAVAVYVVAGLYTGTFDVSQISTWIRTAQQTLSLVNQAIQHKIDELSVKAESEIGAIYDSIEELANKNDEFDNIISFSFDETSVGKPNPIYQSIESYCDGITFTSVEGAADYSEQIAYAINIRNSVIAG